MVKKLLRSVVTKEGEGAWFTIISLAFLLLYVAMQSASIYGGDGGDLVSAAATMGIPHPPGYPLYTFLGYLLTFIPASTISWRVTLLSSVPMALTVAILFLIIYHLIKQKIIALVTSFTFGLTYLVWLHALVPEVFGLHLLLSSLCIYSTLRFYQTKTTTWWYILIFFFALDLAHQQTIVLLIPGVFLFLWQDLTKLIFGNFRKVLNTCLIFIFGLLPLLYLPIAASKNPIINWENPSTLHGFTRVITRAMFGTLSANSSFDRFQTHRIDIFKATISVLIGDITKLGVALFILGIVTLWIAKRRYFWWLFTTIIISGPLFLLWSKFPLHSSYFAATFERFLLLPYLSIFIAIAIGIEKFSYIITQKLGDKLPLIKRVNFNVFFIILPVCLFFINYPKLIGLRTDQTEENLIRDTIKTTGSDSLTFLSEDTLAFGIDYFIATKQLIPNDSKQIYVVRQLADFPYYKEQLHYRFPQLSIQGLEDSADSVGQLVKNNAKNFHVYSDFAFDPGVGYYWKPWGFLFRLERSDIPVVDLVKDRNEQDNLIFSYSEPLQGALKNYQHLTLADVLRVYGRGQFNTGRVHFEEQDYEGAEKFFVKANIYQSSDFEVRLYLATTYLIQNKCKQSEEVLTLLNSTQPDPKVDRLNQEYVKRCHH